jgi:hypothetical protein
MTTSHPLKYRAHPNNWKIIFPTFLKPELEHSIIQQNFTEFCVPGITLRTFTCLGSAILMRELPGLCTMQVGGDE